MAQVDNKSRRRSRLFNRLFPLLMAILIMAAGLGWWWQRKSGPFYKGKPVHVWVRKAVVENVNTYEINLVGSKAAPELLDWLLYQDSSLKRAYRTAYDHIPAFIKSTLPVPADPSEVRRRSLKMLADLGADAASAVPTLVDLLENDHIPVSRIAIAETLGRIGAPARSAIPALKQMMQKQNLENKVDIAGAIHSIRRAPDLIFRLFEMAKTEANANPDSSHAIDSLSDSAKLLGTVEGHPERIVTALMDLIDHPHFAVREMAAPGFAKQGSTGTNAIPHLIRAVQKFDHVGHNVVLSLHSLAKAFPEHQPIIIQTIASVVKDDAKVEGRGNAVYVLKTVGADSAETLPALLDALDTDHIRTRHLATLALFELDPDTATNAQPQITDNLLEILAGKGMGEQKSGRIEAINALAEFDPPPPAAESMLITIGQNNKSPLQASARKTLNQWRAKQK